MSLSNCFYNNKAQKAKCAQPRLLQTVLRTEGTRREKLKLAINPAASRAKTYVC